MGQGLSGQLELRVEKQVSKQNKINEMRNQQANKRACSI